MLATRSDEVKNVHVRVEIEGERCQLRETGGVAHSGRLGWLGSGFAVFACICSCRGGASKCSKPTEVRKNMKKLTDTLLPVCHESELWKSKAGVLVYKDRGGFKIDLATGQN